MATLTTIEGIGPALADKLKQGGVGSTEKLLAHGATPKGRKSLAEATGIEAKRLMRFVNHADLMRIKGVGGEYAELLEAAGVDTVAEMARRNAANLHAKMAEVNEQKKLVRSLATAAKVQDWVEQAQRLPRQVEY